MSKIPIKKTSHSDHHISNDLKVDLRNNIEVEQKQSRSTTGLFLSFFLLLIIIFLVIGWWFSSQKLAFADLIPEQAVVFSLIDQKALYEQISPFYGQGAIIKINDYLSQANLDFKEDVQSLFKEPSAFILMPVNSETFFPFILLFEKKASSAKINQILNKIEPNLKKDFNFSSKIYRQIEMTVLDSIFSPNGYAYAQIDDYFLISNSQESLKMLISFIIDN